MPDQVHCVERATRLIIKYHEDELDEEEYCELMDWVGTSGNNRALFEQLLAPDYVLEKIKELPDLRPLTNESWEKVITAIEREAAPRPRTKVRYLSHVHYFVAIFLLLVAGIWLVVKNPHRTISNAGIDIPNIKAILPGGNKAVLTLSEGASVILESAQKGKIAIQDSVVVEKTDEGQLVYISILKEKKAKITTIYKPSSLERPYEGSSACYSTCEKPVAYNTLTTPKGGKFQVILPDGSKVWLNNSSSLRYPVVFAGDCREVELKGEAYFEIAPNIHQPFKVKVGETLVDVLGTSFNITAYTDENNIKTTLLTGGVRVSAGNAKIVLKPGEQTRISGKKGLEKLKNIDIEGAVAWKNEVFHFEDADIKTVMKALARWYDIEVVYAGEVVDNNRYSGEFPRDLEFSRLLHFFQNGKLIFFIDQEKRKVIISNNITR